MYHNVAKMMLGKWQGKSQAQVRINLYSAQWMSIKNSNCENTTAVLELFRELNPGLLAPEARIIPLDQTATGRSAALTAPLFSKRKHEQCLEISLSRDFIMDHNEFL